MNDQKQAALWAIEGKDVQYRLSSRSGEWDSMSRCTDHEMGCLMRGGWSADWEFRLKPLTVKIGSREVEAPVLEPGALDIVWYWDTDYQAPDNTPASSHYARRLYEKGLSFATKDSCQAAHDAIHALLRGGV